MNLSHTGAKTWTKIHLKLPHPMIRTAQELFVRYRHWKSDDDKKKIVMSCENVSDYKTNSWQKTGQLYTPIHLCKRRRQNPNQHLEGREEYDYVVNRKTGWKWYEVKQEDLPHTFVFVVFMAEFFMATWEFLVVAFFKILQ